MNYETVPNDLKRECSKSDIVNIVINFKMFQGCMSMWEGHLIFGEISHHVIESK